MGSGVIISTAKFCERTEGLLINYVTQLRGSGLSSASFQGTKVWFTDMFRKCYTGEGGGV